MEETILTKNVVPHGGRLLYFMLSVGDLGQSLAFYTEIVGMHLLRRHDYNEARVSLAFVGFSDDTAMLGLRHHWGHPAPERLNDFGPIAIGIPDWNAVEKRLETAHTTLRHSKTAKGERTAFLNDPDGYEIELIEEKEKPKPLAAYNSMPYSVSLPSKQESPPGKINTKRKDDSRERILVAAGRGFRLRGYGGIGVDGLAKEAGVTSGAFYGHFRSKEDAFQAAVTTGIDNFRAGIEHFRAEQGSDWVSPFARWYLGTAYLEDIAGSCALPSLSPDVVRADSSVRQAYETELQKLAAAVAAGLPSTDDSANNTAEKEAASWVFLALLAGGVTLARAVENKELETKIANSVRDAVIGLAKT